LQAKAALTSRKQVEPKKLLDLKTRSKKVICYSLVRSFFKMHVLTIIDQSYLQLVEPRREASITYKRIKQHEDSPLKKKQRYLIIYVIMMTIPVKKLSVSLLYDVRKRRG
jgi:hypothetical protein